MDVGLKKSTKLEMPDMSNPNIKVYGLSGSSLAAIVNFVDLSTGVDAGTTIVSYKISQDYSNFVTPGAGSLTNGYVLGWSKPDYETMITYMVYGLSYGNQVTTGFDIPNFSHTDLNWTINMTLVDSENSLESNYSGKLRASPFGNETYFETTQSTKTMQPKTSQTISLKDTFKPVGNGLEFTVNSTNPDIKATIVSSRELSIVFDETPIDNSVYNFGEDVLLAVTPITVNKGETLEIF